MNTETKVRLVLDLSETKGGPLLADWLRWHAAEIARESAGGVASVADDMRLIAEHIDAAYIDAAYAEVAP